MLRPPCATSAGDSRPRSTGSTSRPPAKSPAKRHLAEITDAKLRSAAPAVFAEAPLPGASTRYTFLPTGQILSAMRQEGWKPVSHDRSSGYQLHAGLFRFVCRNGMMVADSLIPSIHVRHTGQEIGQIIQASFQILEQLPKLADRVAKFRTVGLSDSIARQFARFSVG